MEVTRHFTASIYPVYENTTLLHDHPALQLWLPPGGHVQRDELPHEAALREAREETGLELELLQQANGAESATARPLPPPERMLLEDITTTPEGVSHQHIDFIYFGRSSQQKIDPSGAFEANPACWEWVTREQLRNQERFDQDVSELGRLAIDSNTEY